MTRLKDIPLPVQELTDESAAAISGGLSVGGLRPLSSLPWIGQEKNVFPSRGGKATNSPEAFILEVSKAKELASEEKELAKELLETIEEEL
jgi:hypothetical protein